MRYFKVYANCAYASRPVREISSSEVAGCIDDLIRYNIGEYSWKHQEENIDEDAWRCIDEKITDVIYNVWKEDGFLQCGDFALYRVEDDEAAPERSNMYGYDLFTDDIK